MDFFEIKKKNYTGKFHNKETSLKPIFPKKIIIKKIKNEE